MDPNVHRSRGRPFGGVCFIVSKDISFRQHYTDSRCLSIILLDSNTLLSNVYMPYNNPRISVDENHELYLQALGHLRASHDLANGMSNYITVGDFNYDPNDTSARANLMPLFLDEYTTLNVVVRRGLGCGFCALCFHFDLVVPKTLYMPKYAKYGENIVGMLNSNRCTI